jgi:ABC-type antimicrobial peptide transport system permease subunit
VRLALGARAADLLRLTLVRGVAPAAAGIGIGIALALASGRVVAGLLFDVSPYDPPVFLTVSAVLLVASVVASLIPARRVTRVDPLIAMRSD